MGGYYNEPEDAIDQSQTHMVFGLRCIETAIVASTTSETNDNKSPKEVGVRGLQPVGEEEYGQLMINHLLSQRRISSSSSTSSMSVGAGAIKYEYTDTLQQQQQQPQYHHQRQTMTGLVLNVEDWSTTKIVEIGSSSTGLFAYHCLGVESVVQCHTGM